MPDDILRMRATVSSEEALENIRKIGREFGLLPGKAKPPIDQLNTSFASLGNTIRKMGGELRAAVPALGAFGFGAAGVGVAAGALIGSLKGIADKVVELKYRSKELGMSERELRAWINAADKVGVSSGQITQGLESFRDVMEGLRYNIGGVRGELYQMGLGPIVRQMQTATTQGDKLKIAFQFKDQLMRDDPTGFKARLFFDAVKIGAGNARLSYDEFMQTLEKTKPLTDAQIAQTKKFRDGLIDLGKAFDDITQKAGIALMPGLTNDLTTLGKVIDYLNDIKSWRDAWDKLPKELFDFSIRNPLENLPPANTPFTAPGGINPLLPGGHQALPGGGTLGGGYSPIAFREGFGAQGGGDASEGSRMVQRGVFDALVQFQTYVQTGATAREGGGGFTPATLTTGAPAGTSTGGGTIQLPPGTGFNGQPASAPPGDGSEPPAEKNLTPGSGGGTAGATAVPPGATGGYTPIPKAGGYTPAPPGAVSRGAAGAPPPAGPQRTASLPPGGGVPSVRPQGATGEMGPAAALAYARQHLGEHEIANQTKLSQFFRDHNINVNPRTVPWCAAFVNASLDAAHIKGTGSLAAGSFTRYGTGVEGKDVKPGDIAVVRGTSPLTNVEGMHVGFVTGRTRMGPRGLEVEMLSGNEDDAVREKWRPASSLHLRRPPSPEGTTDVARATTTDRLNAAVNPPAVNATGTVNVHVTAPRGTKSTASSDGMFTSTTVKRTPQMQQTDTPPGPG